MTQEEVAQLEKNIKKLKAQQEAEAGGALKELSGMASKVGVQTAAKQAALSGSEEEAKVLPRPALACQPLLATCSQSLTCTVPSMKHGMRCTLTATAMPSNRRACEESSAPLQLLCRVTLLNWSG